MSVLSFLTQSADVYRWTEQGPGTDGQPAAAWALQVEGEPCRLMYDNAQATGNEQSVVAMPRAYFQSGADVKAQDELVIDGQRYSIDKLFGPAEGGDHYTVAYIRSNIIG